MTIVHRSGQVVATRTTFGYLTDSNPRLDRIQNLISAACGTVAGMASLAMVLLTLTELVTRNLFNTPLSWSVGLTEMYLLPIVAFFGIVTAYRAGAHIAVVTVFNSFPPIIRKCLILLSHLLVLLGFAILAWCGFAATQFAWEAGQGPIPGSSLILIPGWVMESIVPIASSLGAVIVCIDIYREISTAWTIVSTDYDAGNSEVDELEQDMLLTALDPSHNTHFADRFSEDEHNGTGARR